MSTPLFIDDMCPPIDAANIPIDNYSLLDISGFNLHILGIGARKNIDPLHNTM
jgi:hypothetical protein